MQSSNGGTGEGEGATNADGTTQKGAAKAVVSMGRTLKRGARGVICAFTGDVEGGMVQIPVSTSRGGSSYDSEPALVTFLYLHPGASVLFAGAVTIHHTLYTIHHTPYTLCTILHTPYSMHHAPYSILHTPCSSCCLQGRTTAA
jgi:hypothetical protein